MYSLITEHGERIKLPNKLLTNEIKDRTWSSSYIVSNNLKLQKIYILNGFKRTYDPLNKYEYIADKKFDHSPNEEEIISFMAKHEILISGYITIEEGYETYEIEKEEDE